MMSTDPHNAAALTAGKPEKNTSHPTCKAIKNITIPHEKTLERSKTLLPQKSQNLLKIHDAEITVPPPPSYHAVLLQKYSENLLQPSHAISRCPAEFLRQVESEIPPTTTVVSEKGVLKYLTAFSELDFSCTPEYARKAPRAIIEKIRRFLLYCVARDSGVDNIIRLSKNESLHFLYLSIAYDWSWIHQIEHGWESTSPKTQLRAYETFHLFIELPLRHLRVPLSAFLWHVKVHGYICRLPRGSSLFDKPPRSCYYTLQAMRSRGQLNRLEELLRMNDMILGSDVDNLHLHPKIFRACKKEIAAERRACIPPEICSNKFQHTMNDHPEWPRFMGINRDRTSEFGLLRPCKARKGDTNEKTRTAGGSKVELLPDFSTIRHELESTLKGLIQKMRGSTKSRTAM